MPATALILIDIQNDYFPGGRWPVDEMDRVAGMAAGVLTRARRDALPVFHVHHEATSDSAPFFRPGTSGAEIHASVTPQGDEPKILKHRPNSFLDTELHDRLQAAGVRHVTLAGAMTQMCIDATARAARDLGYGVTVVADSCAARAQTFGGVALSAAEVQAAFLGALAMSYAKVVDSDALVWGD